MVAQIRCLFDVRAGAIEVALVAHVVHVELGATTCHVWPDGERC